MTDVLAVIARAISFAAVITMMGAVSFRWLVLTRWPRSSDRQLETWSALLGRAGLWAAAGLLIVAVPRLYAQASGLLADPADPVVPMMGRVLATHWGSGWLFQTAAAVIAVAGFGLVRRKPAAGSRSWVAASFASVLLVASPSFMGHAAAAERYLGLSLVSDWIHVAAASAWIGGLVSLTLVTVGSTAAPKSGDESARLVELFHPVALGAASLLVVTGVASLLLRVPSLGLLFPSVYGGILLVKLALTAGVAALGARHATHGARLIRTHGMPAVARTLVAETVLAAAVIAATGLLAGTAPPMPPMAM